MNLLHRSRIMTIFVFTAVALLLLSGTSITHASPVGADALATIDGGEVLQSVVDVQKYARAIHIMAMLLVGFGFLMVFVRKYGRSAVTATYLLVATAIPLYFIFDDKGVFGHATESLVDRLILAEFAAASLLICAGAILGRAKMWQYIILGVLFIPAFMLNEWIVLEGHFGLIEEGAVLDTGGSIIIHAFGALFGLGLLIPMTSQKEYETEIEADDASDRFSLLGSMVLWVFWPSFCGALVAPDQIPHTAANVILALCGSTLATYFATVIFRGGKISPADIANAALAGGVAIGATCAKEDFLAGAFVIGLLAGLLSTFGFAVIQSRLQSILRKTDTCGVLYLHGLPGLMGGFAAIFFMDAVGAQIKGIIITAVIAIIAGLIAGFILNALGKRQTPYVDAEEFEL